jgi:hypothetical protein
VVVAEQVQHAVHGEQLELGLGGVAVLLGLDRRHLGAEHHVAQQDRLGLVAVAAPGPVRPGHRVRAQLVHREREDVGRAGLFHPLLVQVGHVRLVHQQHGQVGQRVRLHLADHVLRELPQRVLVGRHPRFVVDFDAHRRVPRLEWSSDLASYRS